MLSVKIVTVKNIFLSYLFCFFTIPYAIGGDVKYGLDFSSFEVVQEMRTGLNLTPEKPFSFPNGFTLTFDARFQSNYKYSFGYVFRVIGQNENNVDLLLRDTNLVVTHMGKTITNFSFRENDIKYDEYFPFEIQFDIKNNELNISLKGKRVTAKNVSMKDFKVLNVAFGKCDHPRFQVSDVPKMSIKNVEIKNEKGLPVYLWSLSKHGGDGSVYDELGKKLAYTENPQWILNNHAMWKSMVSFNTSYRPQICYNVDEKSVAIFEKNYIYSFGTDSYQLKEEVLTEGLPDNYYANQIAYNHLLHTYNSFFDVGDVVLTYDNLANAWERVNEEKVSEILSAYHLHHNKMISPYDSCLYIFCGYGHHQYNNTINRYDFKTKSWEKLIFSGDQIQPRYLSGLGVIDETKILLFGGYGSETGVQELSPQNYYDLYIVDIKEKSIRKIWEMVHPDDNFVVANSIVVDTLNKCFYALCFQQQRYNTFLQLGKFSMESPEYKLFSNNIPFAFHDLYSYVDLFLNEKSGELIAITSSPVITDSTSIVSIYSLNYPPLGEDDLYQVKKDDRLLYLIIAFVCLFLLLISIVFFRKKKEALHFGSDTVQETVENKGTIEQTQQLNPESYVVNKKAILLFGGFQVLDKEGNNVTGEFSPLLKQLFLIILLNTLKDGKGVSSLKLRETLWFDKTQESARNNRGVMLSRLRQILEQVGVVNIENRNSFWIIEFGDDVYCDYYEVIKLMKRLKGKAYLTNEDVTKLLAIISGGEMLHNLQFDWEDSFKADFSNDLIDVLLDIIQNSNLKLSPQDSINLADAIFIHDFLNEDALKLKCRTLISMRKNGLAKGVYTSFVKEYQISFGVNFKYSFEQIIS